jgi:glycosyltransferase involved in cell wall biosynthesis
MNIEAYIIAFNEAETIHLTINHYQNLGAKIKIFDNYSTDKTVEITKSMGCEVESFGVKGQLNDAHYLKIKNRCWKGSQADWVIVCDADEILYVSPIRLHKAKDSGFTIFNTIGFNVYSHDMPKDRYSDITTCIPDENYSKLVIFDPKRITDMMYQYGCHRASPCGQVVYSNDVLSLYHYRAIGGPDRMVKRHALYRSRLSDLNKTLGLGIHYTYKDERRVKEWHEYYERSVTYSQGGI